MITRTILTIFNKLLYMYIFILTIRIVFSWFKPNIDASSHKNTSKLWHYLCLLTGPYLALFRGLKNFRAGTFDFTPIIAVFVLLIASQSSGLLVLTSRITPGNTIIAGFLGVWEAFQIILFFFLFLCVVRLLGLFIHNRIFDRFLDIIDLVLQPWVSFILPVTHRKLSYQTMLFLCIGLIAVIGIAGGFSFKSLYRELFLMM